MQVRNTSARRFAGQVELSRFRDEDLAIDRKTIKPDFLTCPTKLSRFVQTL